MKNLILPRKIVALALLGLLTLAVATSVRLHAEDNAAVAAQTSPLSKRFVGTWILVGKPGKVGEAPASGGRLKFLTGSHWTVTQADPETGVTVFHHGGTYSLEGDQYTETVEYANQNTAELLKKTFKFTIKIEGDTMTQTGIGNPWTEVWKRLD
jgi:hypothetical protein